jgi:DNA (cytosine-5)-methyltransferase 1
VIYGSVCSGIEAATVAWEPLGWKAQWFSEIDSFPRAVLKHHYPKIKNLGDMTKLHESETFNGRPIELLVGGCPCQSFSVAGLRKGLADPRGNLTLHLLKILDLKRPRWLVYENVPGLLSSWSDEEGSFTADPNGAARASGPRGDGGNGTAYERGWQINDFDTFTSGLRELGYGVAWRILDAQYFGVAQRRRRVFVVGHLGDWRPAAAVLFESQSLRGDSPPRRKKGQGPAAGPADSLGSRGNRSHTELDGHGAYIPEVQEVADALRSGSTNKASHGKLNGSDRVTLVPQAFGGNNTTGPLDVATAVTAKGGSGHMDFESETFIQETAHSLRADGFDASEDGTGRGTPLVPVSKVYENHAQDSRVKEVNVAPQLNAKAGTGGGNLPLVQEAFTFEARVARNGRGAPSDVVSPLKAQSGEDGRGDAAPLVSQMDMQVRRLTPRECERLQGFPDDYTLIPHGKSQVKDFLDMFEYLRRTYPKMTEKEARRLAADGPRYKALGNSMAIPCMAWIGRRIQAVEDILNAKNS